MDGIMPYAVFMALRDKVKPTDLDSAFRGFREGVSRYSGDAILVVFLLFVLVVLIIILSSVLKLKIVRKKTFGGVADEYGLNPNEKEVLALMARTLPEAQRDSIFGSRRIFELAVNNYIFTLKHKKVSQTLFRLRENHIHSIRRKLNFAPAGFGEHIHSTRELKPEQKIVLEPLDKRFRYNATVTAITEKDIHATLQIDEDEIPGLEDGETFTGHFWRAGEGLYSFKTTLESLSFKEKPQFVLNHAVNFEYTQNREFPRIDVSRRFRFSVLRTDAVKTDKRIVPKEYRGVLKDISGGGLRFTFEGHLNAGDYIAFDFNLQEPPKEPEKIALIAEVLDIGKEKGGSIVARAEFIATPDESRDMVVAFVEEKLKIIHTNAEKRDKESQQ